MLDDLRTLAPVRSPIIILVPRPCGSSRAERLCDPSELRVRRLTAYRLGRALRSPTAGSAGSGCKPSRRISRQSVLIRRPAFPPTFSAAALAVSAAIDCKHGDARGRELRNASGPEEKKTLERQIKDQDDLINRYQADLTKRGG